MGTIEMLTSLFLNPRVIGVVVGILLILGALLGAYAKGKSVERARWELITAKVKAEAEERARLIEQAKNAEVQKVSANYEDRLESLNDRFDATSRELGRLRVKARSCSDLPKIAGPTGKSNEAASRPRDGEGEINLDRVAGEVIRLGRDLDACSAQVVGLQEVVQSYVAASR